MHANRRSFLRLIPAAAGMLRLRAADMIIRSTRPEDFEMPLDGFATWITPVERFFIRTHVYTPKVEASQWQLRIEGKVATSLTLSLSELREFPRAELVSVLECAGNGRGFYQPTVAGLQWATGAVGNARWSGVRLADVLKKSGYSPSAKEVLFNGADVPLGTMPDFIRGIPLEKATHPDTLLAFEMNGQPLTPSHGFPLRVVAPGWAGDSWVKWLTTIEVRASGTNSCAGRRSGSSRHDARNFASSQGGHRQPCGAADGSARLREGARRGVVWRIAGQERGGVDR